MVMGSGGTRVGWNGKEGDLNLKEEVDLNFVVVDLDLMEVHLRVRWMEG